MSQTERPFCGLLVTEPDRARIKNALEWLEHEDKYHTDNKAYPAWYAQAIKDCQIIMNRRLAELIVQEGRP